MLFEVRSVGALNWTVIWATEVCEDGNSAGKFVGQSLDISDGWFLSLSKGVTWFIH